MTQKPKVGLKRRGEKGFWKIFSAELKSILFRVCFLKPSIENLRDYNNRGMADCNIHMIKLDSDRFLLMGNIHSLFSTANMEIGDSVKLRTGNILIQ